MHRKCLLMMGGAALLAAASAARADLYDSPATYKVHIAQNNNYAMGNAGEFTITNVSLPSGVVFGASSDISGNSFQTFCVEHSEHIGPPATYWADITDYATEGGGGSNGNKGPGNKPSDDVSPETAYLYTQFRTGALGAEGYEYTPGDDREKDARSLQIAIWLLENERTVGQLGSELLSVKNQAITWRDLAVDAVANNVWTSGIGNVRVLNLWGDANRTIFRQDQLVMIPAPGAAILAALGLGMVGFVRRRFA